MPAAQGRPESAAGALTGVSGIVVAGLAAWLLRDSPQPDHVRTLIVLLISAAAMVAVDILLYRVQDSPGTRMSRMPVRNVDTWRLVQKLVGFWFTIGTVAALYALLPEYQDPFYTPFKDSAWLLLPAVIVASPFYVAYVDRRQDEPDDAYVQVAQLIGGTRPEDWGQLRLHALVWLVKAFFTPLMFIYCNNGLAHTWSGEFVWWLDFDTIYWRLIEILYFCDVLLATVAYTATFRILDNHVRSVEPTVAGWVVCLICYRPLTAAQRPYIQYDADKLYWDGAFDPSPLIFGLWGTAIILLTFIYAWSTVAFGLRFSNLTDRGVITSGPYRFVKHPAYLSKNISWWLISVPFIAGAGWWVAVQSCLMLGALNLIYYLRAVTEERHLSANPVYRDYQRYIEQHGLFARLSRVLKRVTAA